ncbi:MAG: hypothetical protein DDT42_01785 [candidate division WS2 bacterium]|uniref:Uroporphyrinogen decarboxylase (URO-D) domain-containing protein n=1 Tax=Psychracetigena formicireducens TaxID=2986056 RepID=A0A9E2BHZ9_PSYF1|nr:hypothetical protein [Candidatus Psychracetigena formicireducens]
MTDRERFLAVMNYEKPDRCFHTQGMAGPWPETEEKWTEEGYDPSKEPLFPSDMWHWHSGWFFPNPPFEKKIIAEDDKTITYINHEGITMKERKDYSYSSMPQFIRFPVETREEYRKFYKEKFNPDLAARIGSDYKEKLSAYKNRDFPLVVIADRHGGFFGGLRAMLGVEKACTVFYDDPAWVEEMMDGLADFLIATMDKILQYTDVDVFGFWEDMAYKTGPLVGPNLMRKYALPRYKKVVDFLRSKGVKFICLDSDGDIWSLIPVWLDAGINTLYPFEVQCGMDIVEVRKKFGKDLRIWYGIDKRALTIGPKAIDAELERVRPLIEEGGYIPGTDHSLPPDISFTNYCYYRKALMKALGV